MRIVGIIFVMLYIAVSAYFAVKITMMKETPMQSLVEFIDILFSRRNLISNFISAILCALFIPAYIIVMIAAVLFKVIDAIGMVWNWWVNYHMPKGM